MGIALGIYREECLHGSIEALLRVQTPIGVRSCQNVQCPRYLLRLALVHSSAAPTTCAACCLACLLPREHAGVLSARAAAFHAHRVHSLPWLAHPTREPQGPWASQARCTGRLCVCVPKLSACVWCVCPSWMHTSTLACAQVQQHPGMGGRCGHVHGDERGGGGQAGLHPSGHAQVRRCVPCCSVTSRLLFLRVLALKSTGRGPRRGASRCARSGERHVL